MTWPSNMTLLDQVRVPADLRALSKKNLPQLADELRKETIDAVSVTGGHLGAGLGVVELTVALHYVFNTPDDKIIWDVGHQAYPHKILTGRRDRIRTLRQGGGLSGFTKRAESEYDPFGAAHSSTSISAGLGFAVARDLKHEKRNVIAVIGLIEGAAIGKAGEPVAECQQAQLFLHFPLQRDVAHDQHEADGFAAVRVDHRPVPAIHPDHAAILSHHAMREGGVFIFAFQVQLAVLDDRRQVFRVHEFAWAPADDLFRPVAQNIEGGRRDILRVHIHADAHDHIRAGIDDFQIGIEGDGRLAENSPEGSGEFGNHLSPARSRHRRT